MRPWTVVAGKTARIKRLSIGGDGAALARAMETLAKPRKP